MQLLDSHIEAGQDLSDEDKMAYYTALVEYLYYGKEPELTGAPKAVFVAIKPTLDNSLARSKAGSKGGSKRQAKRKLNGSKRESNAKQTAKQNASKTEANVQANQNQTIENRASYQDSPSPYSSPSNPSLGSEGCNSHWEGVQGEGFAPPSLEEVKSYFEANGLKGDPESFFATYDSQGWVKGNGMPVHSWHSLALKWSQEERRRELEKPPEQQPKPSPTPVNLPDKTLEEDVAEFERRYGVKLRG